MIVNTKQKLPIKLWMKQEADLESGAWDQVKNLANYAWAYHHIAIMPDAHQGYGMPIGGVMATEGVIIPNAVGVDIGCGMCAVKTDLKDISKEDLKKIMGKIRTRVPVGFKHHETWQGTINMPTLKAPEDCLIVKQQWQKAMFQLGTLGGGNHFIEIQKGDDGHIWIMIHSGSRNLGYTVAKYYNELAKERNKRWMVNIDHSWDLAFLPLHSQEGKDYIKEMNYCVEFALANRKHMMDNVLKCVTEVFPEATSMQYGGEWMTNIAHNYATLESHFGKNVWVHRKGATLAREGTIGIIPGSQGSKSYIVQGKGNKDSFDSCSHGAGRKMSRSQARKELSLEDESKRLNDMGVIHSIRTSQDLDEAPSAYKNINEVMDNQEDLVAKLVELTPLAVVKG